MKFRSGAAIAMLVVLASGCTNSTGAEPSQTASGLQSKPEITVSAQPTARASTTPNTTSTAMAPSTSTTSAEPSDSTSDDDGGGVTTLADDADLKTFTGTQREYIDAMSACLRKKGIPVDVAEDGTFTFPGLPMGQNTTLEQAQKECLATIGIIQTRNFNDEQLRTYYKLQYDQWKCLRDNGFAVRPAQTFETYRDIARQTGAPTWNAFDGLSGSDIGLGLSKCPNKIAG